jgi:hypothetical protein
MRKRLLFVTVALFSLICVNTAQSAVMFSLNLPKDITIPPKAHIENITYEKVLPEYGECAGGEACVVMALGHYGVKLTQVDVHKASTTSNTRGCMEYELYTVGMNLGIEGGFYDIWGFKSRKDRNHYLDALKYFISQGSPVIVSFDREPDKYVDDFCGFGLAVGYDDSTSQITILDPYGDAETGRNIGYDEFLDRWQYDLKDGGREFMMWPIKGQNKPYKEDLKKIAVHLSSGQTVDYVLNSKTPNDVFVLAHFDKSKMVIEAEAKNASNEQQWKENLNDWTNDYATFRDGGFFSIHITCLKGEGDLTLTYEANDLDLYKK